MKLKKIFLSTLLLVGCQKEADEEFDIDQMVLLEEEKDQKNLAGDPPESPQEVLIKESPNVPY